MEKIFWLGNPYFAPWLESCGWQEVYIHTPSGLEILGWRDILELAGFTPDLVVFGDSSLPPILLGMEDFPCLTAYYSLDFNKSSWRNQYVQGFDTCLVSNLERLPDYAGPFLSSEMVWWSPPFAKDEDKANQEIEADIDCLFVGTINPVLKPGRAAFLAELKNHLPGLQAISGNYLELFPRGRILLNHSEDGGLNFRIFEAMGCGGCLVTPRVNNGLERMFVDGEELVAFAPNDAGDAAYRISFLLENPDLREYIAKTAQEKIDSSHRAIHRAQEFTDHICDLALNDIPGLIRQRQKRAMEIRSQSLKPVYTRWAEEASRENLKNAWLAVGDNI